MENKRMMTCRLLSLVALVSFAASLLVAMLLTTSPSAAKHCFWHTKRSEFP